MLLLASGLVSVAMGQYDDAVSITVVSIKAVVRMAPFAHLVDLFAKGRSQQGLLVESKKNTKGKPSILKR